MAINRFEKFVNPGQIKVSPWELPFEELGLALASKQKSYDEKEAALADIVLPKAGYITEDLGKQVASEYVPRISALEKQLYDTGEVNSNQITQLAKQLAGDKRVELLNQDYAYKGKIDETMSAEAFPYSIQDFYSPESNIFNQIDPNNIEGVNLGQKYRTLFPQEYTNFSGEYVDKVVKPVKDQMVSDGKLFKENGKWYINEEKITYVNGQPVFKNSAEIFDETKNIELVKSRLNDLGPNGISHVEELYNNITGVPKWNWWKESQTNALGREPSVDEFSDMLVNSWMSRTYSYQTVKESSQNLPSPNTGKKTSGGSEVEDTNQIDFWSTGGKRPFAVKQATVVEGLANQLGYNLDEMSYSGATQFVSAMEADLKSFENTLAEPSYLSLNNLNNIALNTIQDLNVRTDLNSKLKPQESINAKFEDGGVTYSLSDKFIQTAVNSGAKPSDIAVIQANLDSEANKKTAEYIDKKNQISQSVNLIKIDIQESGIENLKGFAQQEKALRTEAISEIANNALLLSTDPVPVTDLYKDLITKKLQTEPAALAGATGLFIVKDESGNPVDVLDYDKVPLSMLKGPFGKIQAIEIIRMPALEDKIADKLDEYPEFKEANAKLTKNIKLSTNPYKVEGTIYSFNTMDPTDFADPSQRAQISNMNQSALTYFNNILQNTNNEDIKLALTDEMLADNENDLLNQIKTGGTVTTTGGKSQLEMSFNGEPMTFDMNRFSVRYDIGDGTWMLDINLPELGLENPNANNQRGARDPEHNFIEIALDPVQKQELLEQTGLDLSSLAIREVQKRIDSDLKAYGITENKGSYNTEAGTKKDYYSLQSYRNPDTNENIKTRVSIGGSDVNVEFANSYQLSEFETSLNDAMTRAQHIFSSGAVNEATITQEILSFSQYLGEKNSMMSPAQAQYIAANTINSAFINNDYKQGVNQPVFEVDGKNYLVDPERMQDLTAAGIPTVNSTFSILKVHPDVINPLRAIMSQFPKLFVTNALRSKEDLKELTDAGFHTASNSLHLRGLGVDLDGVSEEQLSEIHKYLGKNMPQFNLSNAVYHDGHLHLEFNTIY